MFRSTVVRVCSRPLAPLLRDQRRFRKKIEPIPLPPPIKVDPEQYAAVKEKDIYFPPLSAFRTSETDPAKLDKSHLGRFYTVDPEFYKNVMVPVACYPPEFKTNCNTLNEVAVLVRKPFLDVKACIESSDLKKPVVRYVIYGPTGSGRSMTMASLVHYGYSREFVLINVPWAPLWSRFCKKEVVPSPIREGFVDHTLRAVNFLMHFKIQNSQLLTKLDLRTDVEYHWSKRENTPAGSSLLEVIEHGIARPAHATECVFALIKELKKLSSSQKCKTMVLIDGVNTFYHEHVVIQRPDRSLVPPKMITAFEAFKEAVKPDWTGGVVICSVDILAVPSEARLSDLPRHLLTKEGWEHFDPFVPVRVDNYTSQEVQTTIDYFIDKRWLTHPLAGSELGRIELEYLSTRSPLTLMHLCNSR